MRHAGRQDHRPEPLPPGEIALIGDYRILGLLGEGGMARVYEAEHVRLGRRVAVKRLKPPYGERREAVNAFFEEARAVNRVRHPHIVQVTDFVFDPDGAYCVMELLSGNTLAEAIAEQGPMEPARALHIAHQVADALAAAHGAGIVHRDIKPSNIQLLSDGPFPDFVKVLDFGVAQLDETIRRSGETMALGASLGTPAYMSPEQANGQTVDARADLYSLGVVLYECLAGHRPFEAGTRMALIYEHTSVDPTPLRETAAGSTLPASCDALVMRCLQKRPEGRHPSAEALLRDLEAAGHDCGVLLRRGEAPLWLESPRRVPRWLLPGGMISAVVVAAVLGLWLLLGREGATGRTDASSAPRIERQTHARATPSPVQARAEQVELRVQSTPPGAKVERLGARTETLGHTPLVLATARGDVTWTLRISAPGFKPREMRVPVDLSRTILVSLEPAREGAVRPHRPGHARRGHSRRTRLATGRRSRRGSAGRRPPRKATLRTDQGTIDPFH